jgi:hypothetical protein
MKFSVARKLATEIINVLKYNPELTDAERILSLETRLEQLIDDVERGAEETHKRKEENKVIIDDRPQDIQPLADLMIKDQARRGALLN